MNGSIRKRGRQSWELTIDLGRDADGKRRRNSDSGVALPVACETSASDVGLQSCLKMASYRQHRSPVTAWNSRILCHFSVPLGTDVRQLGHSHTISPGRDWYE